MTRLPHAVCFDNDGLTLETESGWTRAEVVLFRNHGSEFTDGHKRYLIGSSGPEAERKLCEMLDLPGHGPELGQELHALVIEEFAREVEPMPGAFELVDALRAAGIPVALVSNSAGDLVRRAMATAGVGERFDLVLTREDVEHGKPAPDLYLEACARLGASPERSVGLEDSATGVASLKAAGLYAIGVPSFPGITLDEADLVVASLEDPAVWGAVGL
jgi:HAD superfamily hydrolase (TIGR01509 family)